MATVANPALQPASAFPSPEVNWLFLDLNSYFASVEQEVRPELRGKPVGVVAVDTDTTVCIAASYEAKALGVKTGTMVKDARQLCPEIVLVEARHEIYVDYHHRIVKAVESCLPVTAVLSIDEMACRLIGRERPLLAAMRLAQRVKQAIKDQVGSTLRCSVGLAPNRYLAKIASDMEKPDGLVALTRDIFNEALLGLKLQDLPGVGAKTEKRLNERGIRSMADLMAALEAESGREQTGELWGSVWGERHVALAQWRRLRSWKRHEHAKSMGHQHVLAPEFRNPESAWAVAHKLLHKAAMRMRSEKLWASRIGLSLAFMGQEPHERVFALWARQVRELVGGDAAARVPGQRHADRRAAQALGNSAERGAATRQPFFLSVVLAGLVPDALHSLTLFDAQDGSEGRMRLAETMDTLNNKYGMSTLAPATMLAAYKAAPTRIAFRSVPELFDHSQKGISGRLSLP